MSPASPREEVSVDPPLTTLSSETASTSPLQLDLIELHTEILLSRAHLAFYIFAEDGTEAQGDRLHEGKAALEEAERLYMSQDRVVNKLLEAKCWYMRGFLADVCGEQEQATKHFQRAVGLDETYKQLKRVQWLLQRDGDAEEFNGVNMVPSEEDQQDLRPWSSAPEIAQEITSMWDATFFTGDRGNPRGLMSESDSGPLTGGLPNMARLSALFGSLFLDVLQKHPKTPPRDASKSSPPGQRIASAAAGSPQTPNSGRLDMDGYIEKLKNPPTPKRKFPAPKSAPPKAEGPRPIRVQIDSNRLAIAKLAAAVESRKQDRLAREHALQKLDQDHARRMALYALTGVQPLGEETLLSDTPSISELDSTVTAPASDVRPRKLSIDTSVGRRQSTSYAASPASPSPLRTAFIPDDDIESASTVKATESTD